MIESLGEVALEKVGHAGRFARFFGLSMVASAHTCLRPGGTT